MLNILIKMLIIWELQLTLIIWIALFYVFFLSIPGCISSYMTTLYTLLTEPWCWVSGEWPSFVKNWEPPPPPAWAPHGPPIPRLASQSAGVYGMWLQESGQIRPFRQSFLDISSKCLGMPQDVYIIRSYCPHYLIFYSVFRRQFLWYWYKYYNISLNLHY